jgi:hypothetical protein
MNVKRYSIAQDFLVFLFAIAYTYNFALEKLGFSYLLNFTTNTGRDAIAIKYVIRRTVFKVRNNLDNSLSIFPKKVFFC